MPYRDRNKQRAVQAKWSRSNRARLAAKVREHRAKIRAELNEIKVRTGCVDCRKKYPYYVLDFDHVGTDKVLNVSALLKEAGIERVRAEVRKCEVVCSNCHRERTHRRKAKTAPSDIG